MNRWMVTLTGLALAAGLAFFLSRSGLAEETKTFPGDPFTPAKPAQPTHPLFKGLNKSSNNPAGTHPPGLEESEPNQDIKVTPQAGEWMICIHSYKGPEAHRMARELVSVLRSKPYQLWAYVYNYTADAKRQKELERQQMIERYKQLMKLTGQTELKVKIPSFKIEEEVGVLVGGYKDMETARRALDELKKLEMPDPKLVQLDTMWIIKDKKPQEVYVNPLTNGFVVRNPSLPKQVKEQEWDLALLKRLNADEPYSLLRCPRKITLAIKEYRLPVYIKQDNAFDNPLKKVAAGPSENRPDISHHNAHTLAEWLRDQRKLDAYVLHTQTSSVVTVGGFESLDDPQIKTMQQQIATLHREFAQMAQQNPQFDALQIFPIGFPMKVPR